MGELNLQGIDWIRRTFFPSATDKAQKAAMLSEAQNRQAMEQAHLDWLKSPGGMASTQTGFQAPAAGVEHTRAQAGLLGAQKTGVDISNRWAPVMNQADVNAKLASTGLTKTQTEAGQAAIPFIAPRANAEIGLTNEQAKNLPAQRALEEQRMRNEEAGRADQTALGVEQLRAGQDEGKLRSATSLLEYSTPDQKQMFLRSLYPNIFPAAPGADPAAAERQRQVQATMEKLKGKGQNSAPGEGMFSKPLTNKPSFLSGLAQLFGKGQPKEPSLQDSPATAAPPKLSVPQPKAYPPKPLETGGQTAFGGEGVLGPLERLWNYRIPDKSVGNSPVPTMQSPQMTTPPVLPQQQETKPSLMQLMKSGNPQPFKGSEAYAPQMPEIPMQLMQQYLSPEVMQNPQLVQQLIAALLQQGMV